MDFALLQRYNPNPICKILAIFAIGITLWYRLPFWANWGIILGYATLYLANGLIKYAVLSIATFGILSLVPDLKIVHQLPMGIRMFLVLIVVVKLFYLTFEACRFFVKTTSVGSLMAYLEALHVPITISIPLAVGFRFFPAYTEEKSHIKMAMKVRGIRTYNPWKYFEYIAVPLLISSSNIADDIAKAAETRCIENPIKKTSYIKVETQMVDIVFTLYIAAFIVGGLAYA